MKFLLPMIFATMLTSCSKLDPPKASTFVEEGVLWKGKIHPESWVPLEMESVLKNDRFFTPDSRTSYYKSTGILDVFGGKAVYANMIGYDMLAGPNVIIKGKPSDVSNYISEKYGIKLIEKDGKYSAELIKDVRLLIGPNPNNKEETIVIGSYFGA